MNITREKREKKIIHSILRLVDLEVSQRLGLPHPFTGHLYFKTKKKISGFSKFKKILQMKNF